MGAARSMSRLALAVLVIAHGWGHAVLPLRGAIPSEALAQNFFPLVFYAVAMVGFTAAGVGVLGVPPFAAATRPLLVIASVYSLVALGILGHGDLWWGAAIDVVLLLAGLTGVFNRLPSPAAQGQARRAFRIAVGSAVVAYTVTAALWPIYRAWGTRPDEYQLDLPGDGPQRRAALEIQHAVTIDAPPAAVWPWLLQIGQDRGGFYSYDWLERAFGVDVHTVAEIRPEWQHREVGELVRATQPGYLGGVLGPDLGWRVREVEAERALVLEYWGTFALVPAGDATTRFIIRTPIGHERMPVWAAALDMMTFQLPHFIMERRMMLRIKTLAEASAVS